MLPGLLGLIGISSSGLALAPALRELTWPLFIVSLLVLSRSWYLEASGRKAPKSRWKTTSSVVVLLSTTFWVAVWWIRFVRVFGEA